MTADAAARIPLITALTGLLTLFFIFPCKWWALARSQVHISQGGVGRVVFQIARQFEDEAHLRFGWPRVIGWSTLPPWPSFDREFATPTTMKLPWSHCILAGIGTRERVPDFARRGLPVPDLDVIKQAELAGPRGRRGDFATGRSDNPAGRGPGRVRRQPVRELRCRFAAGAANLSSYLNEKWCLAAAAAGGSLV